MWRTDQGGPARNAGPMTWQPPPMVRPPADRLRIAGRRSVTAGRQIYPILGINATSSREF
jgi:hypothetical protein